jgi:hypothetical protein
MIAEMTARMYCYLLQQFCKQYMIVSLLDVMHALIARQLVELHMNYYCQHDNISHRIKQMGRL